ncbi:TetR/AcrR family transcriptional regulator [Arthrobacter silvisoli]|uniref:TetR/AcrR family transcriptional regulator n=1 Tax=Arthrobacter silvisoli TaxID=2291022 RepID=UPI000E219419|nr:TetR/AcrR family transcriptional regulator [Arthrobacter silvisoli]
MPASKYHRENLRATLLELAEATVRSSGVESLSLRQLARDAGVSHAAPARHFRDRQALLDALAFDGFERLNAMMSDAAGSEGSFETRFRALATAYVDFAVENAALLGLMYIAKHAEGASDALIAAGRRSMDLAVSLVAAAQAAGQVIPGDSGRIALVVFASVHGVASLATDELLDGMSVEDATAATVELLLRAITVTPR